MAGGVRVGIAFDDVTLEPDPTWTFLTDDENFVASFSVDRGRSFELDRTDTGTATVVINDVLGLADPTNSSGPWYGKLEPLLQIRLEILNPVTDTYSVVYRGFIEDYDYTEDPSQKVAFLSMSCVDAFEILTAIEMQPDGTLDPPFGDQPPLGAEGQVFFDNAEVNDRIAQVLNNAGWPPDLAVIFSGNVTLLEATYSPSDTVLQVLQDCADAEFPGVGNVFTDRTGRVAFHGRGAKADPAGVSAGAGVDAWPWHHWKAGDGVAVAASISDTAQIRSLSFNRGLSKIINSATASPVGIADEDIPGQWVRSDASIAQYGFRSWSAENLFTEGGKTDGLDANEETLLFAQYYVDNYAQPRNRISAISFRSMSDTDARAAANWALLCGAEISDLIDVSVTNPGGGGFTAEAFFIEGVHYDVHPLNGDYADVTLTLDLSPRSYFPAEAFEPAVPDTALAVSISGNPYEDSILSAEATGGV